MKIGIYGGSYNKPSGVIQKLSESFYSDTHVVNGFTELPKSINHDLTIWMVDVNNSISKQYPIKKKKSILICSKLMHNGVREIDAVSRIFKMRGNAVIAIYTNEKPYRFKLIDALGNIWYNGNDIKYLSTHIMNIYHFLKESIRYNSIPKSMDKDIKFIKDEQHLKDFIKINSRLKNHIQNSCGDRFFGNLSTRCSKLFPSYNGEEIWVSPRNINKEYIEAKDMVIVKLNEKTVLYDGIKPSIDSPSQLLIYNENPHIHYMIHGHANIKDFISNSNYYTCGDVREAEDINKLIKSSNVGGLNLLNHGFILYSDTLENLKNLIDRLINENKFYYRGINKL